MGENFYLAKRGTKTERGAHIGKLSGDEFYFEMSQKRFDRLPGTTPIVNPWSRTYNVGDLRQLIAQRGCRMIHLRYSFS